MGSLRWARPSAAAELYRRALALDPTSRHARPAVQALAALSIAAGRIEDAAAILERFLQTLAQGDPQGETQGPVEEERELERWAREMLVGLSRIKWAPGRAIPTSDVWWCCGREAWRRASACTISIWKRPPTRG